MPDENDDVLEAEYGFEPAAAVTGTAAKGDAKSDAKPVRERRRLRRARASRSVTRSPWRRRVGATALMLGSLASMGGIYAALAGSSDASNAGYTAEQVSGGRNIYQVSCITCHGANLQGVQGQGPALIGVGGAAVYFQVSTGRMPLVAQGAYAPRKEAKFDSKQTEELSAYIQSLGGGPMVPHGSLRASTKGDNVADGGALFRLNCASCHGTTFKGAPLSAGKIAPSLNAASDKQIYAAMLSGPENMPVFSDNQLTPTEKRQIIAYVQTLKASKDPGGSGIDRIGPVSEAIVIWAVGVGGLMIAILWIGARVR